MNDSDWQAALSWLGRALLALVALLALLWVLGWGFSGLGALMLQMARWLVVSLRFLVPVGLMSGVVYLAAKLLRR